MSRARAVSTKKKKPWFVSPSVKVQKEYNVALELRKIFLEIKWRDGATCCSNKDCRQVKWCFWHKEALVLETDWETPSTTFLIGDTRSTYSCLLFQESTKDLRDFLIAEGVAVQLGDIVTLQAKVCNCKNCEAQSEDMEMQLELSPAEQTGGELYGKDRLTDYDACLAADPSVPVSVVAYCDQITNEPCYVMVNQLTGQINKNANPTNWILPYKETSLVCKEWKQNFAAIGQDLKLTKDIIIQLAKDAGVKLKSGDEISDIKQAVIHLKNKRGQASFSDGSVVEATTSDMLVVNCNGYNNVDDGGMFDYQDVDDDFCVIVKKGSVITLELFFA